MLRKKISDFMDGIWTPTWNWLFHFFMSFTPKVRETSTSTYVLHNIAQTYNMETSSLLG